jgi:hypothetical protein
MRNQLKKLLAKNLQSESPNWNLHALLIWILYPEFRNGSLLEFVKITKPLIAEFSKSIFIIISIFISGYFLKAELVKSEINKLVESKAKIVELNLEIDSLILRNGNLEKVIISRDYWNWKIINETGITHTSDFKKLPDEVFFEAIHQCDKLKIPYRIFFRIMQRESKFQFIKNKTGSGAFGYMQVMPQTFSRWERKLGLRGGHNQMNNIIVAANLISSIRDFWKVSKSGEDVWKWTLAEYACGRAALTNGIPGEVMDGVKEILK